MGIVTGGYVFAKIQSGKQARKKFDTSRLEVVAKPHAIYHVNRENINLAATSSFKVDRVVASHAKAETGGRRAKEREAQATRSSNSFGNNVVKMLIGSGR